jgi:hypothetical protein
MKTATAIYTAESVTASSESKSGANGVRVDLNSLTVNDATIHAVVTNGASAPNVGESIILNYAFSNTDFNGDGATTFKATLGPSAQQLKLTTNAIASSKRVFTTDKITIRARYIYVWLDYSSLANTITLDASLIT